MQEKLLESLTSQPVALGHSSNKCISAVIELFLADTHTILSMVKIQD